jgi:hypothetical protein
MGMSHGVFIGALDVQDLADGYWFDIDPATGPTAGVPTVSGQRVLIPGREGYYTPSAAGQFEKRLQLVRLEGSVFGVGATRAARRLAFRAAVLALKTACAVETRADVVIKGVGPMVEGLDTGDEATISAGWLRFESPVHYGWEQWDTVIEFEATNPPEWEVTLGS